jgi:lipopolysaccharide/colanic/teichoic acid biosynthesis glycosyltransferase
MRAWPVILDSRPTYVRGQQLGRGSLLLAPYGATVLLEHVMTGVGLATSNPPVVVAPPDAPEEYAGHIRAICPNALVVTTPDAFKDAIGGHELSDALLFVDPRCMPLDGLDLSELIRQQAAEPRVARHAVAFEFASAGTKERVSFDASGQVRGIQRHYDQATWPFISGVAVSLVPFSCVLVSELEAPSSLIALRETLTAHGVPSRDHEIEGGAINLADERGMLSANERFLLGSLSRGRDEVTPSAPLLIGGGQTIADTVRMMGPVVVHPGATIEPNASIFGPAVIGAGARIGAAAVIAHAVVGPDCVVPPRTIVRDRAWFAAEGAEADAEPPPLTFSERLARLSYETPLVPPVVHRQGEHRVYFALKRALDITAALIGLTLFSPFFAIIVAAIRLESKGGIFFGDEREGLGGRVFKCWKFRTMYTGAELAQHSLKQQDHTDGPHFKVERDPRVTRVGRVLRALNVDEIPQLFNVLFGEMSLVGPRPSPFRENQICVPWRAARLSVRPGISGFWQVCRHNRAAGDFHQWIEYDLLYVQHLSLMLDLKIIAATLVTLGGKVAHVPTSWLVSHAPDVPPRPWPAQPAPGRMDRVA